MWRGRQATAAETGTEAFYRRLANARIKKANRETHSLRCDVNLKLGVRRPPARPPRVRAACAPAALPGPRLHQGMLRVEARPRRGAQVAREFAAEDAFYFPHNLDFRGRAYPMHPHLNHLGNDVCRGLLSFADARPLGRSGLGWLYVQARPRAARSLCTVFERGAWLQCGASLIQPYPRRAGGQLVRPRRRRQAALPWAAALCAGAPDRRAGLRRAAV